MKKQTCYWLFQRISTGPI
eukprot:UN14088